MQPRGTAHLQPGYVTQRCAQASRLASMDCPETWVPGKKVFGAATMYPEPGPGKLGWGPPGLDITAGCWQARQAGELASQSPKSHNANSADIPHHSSFSRLLRLPFTCLRQADAALLDRAAAQTSWRRAAAHFLLAAAAPPRPPAGPGRQSLAARWAARGGCQPAPSCHP